MIGHLQVYIRTYIHWISLISVLHRMYYKHNLTYMCTYVIHMCTYVRTYTCVHIHILLYMRNIFRGWRYILSYLHTCSGALLTWDHLTQNFGFHRILVFMKAANSPFNPCSIVLITWTSDELNVFHHSLEFCAKRAHCMDISVYYMYVRMFMCMSGVEDVYLHMYTFPRLWMTYLHTYVHNWFPSLLSV
jgi:hypothetical protein